MSKIVVSLDQKDFYALRDAVDLAGAHLRLTRGLNRLLGQPTRKRAGPLERRLNKLQPKLAEAHWDRPELKVWRVLVLTEGNVVDTLLFAQSAEDAKIVGLSQYPAGAVLLPGYDQPVVEVERNSIRVIGQTERQDLLPLDA